MTKRYREVLLRPTKSGLALQKRYPKRITLKDGSVKYRMGLAVDIESPDSGDYVPEENTLIVYLSKDHYENLGMTEILGYIYHHYTNHPIEHMDRWVESVYPTTWYLNDDLETIA